jgi:protein-disulfide isomerase
MKMNKNLATVVLAGLSVIFVFAFKELRPNPDAELKKRLSERSLGSEKAALWITEYFDYQCPPCARASHLLKEQIGKNPGKIYLQVKHFPLPGHKNAMKAAVYGECASRQAGKFWHFHEKDAGLDLKKLDACVADLTVQTSVEQEKAKGQELGVQTTPTFFVNGQIHVGLIELQKALDKELA